MVSAGSDAQHPQILVPTPRTWTVESIAMDVHKAHANVLTDTQATVVKQRPIRASIRTKLTVGVTATVARRPAKNWGSINASALMGTLEVHAKKLQIRAYICIARSMESVTRMEAPYRGAYATMDIVAILVKL